MTSLVLRLAGPLQSWAGYRYASSMNAVTPTAPVPRKSGVSGLVGAALGRRDLDAICDEFALHVRVERSNPVAEDFQVMAPLPGYVSPDYRGRATILAERSENLSKVKASKFPNPRAGGTFPTTVTRKQYLAHSEYFLAIESDKAVEWLDAFKEPVFMPYLGRRSCPPSFPFIIGLWGASVDELWSRLPHVSTRASEDGSAVLRGYHVTGDYDLHAAVDAGPYSVPVVATREAQIAWIQENLP